ncbi:hypothetical protein PAECIP111891_05005 [Paenibacillus allorhizoplanae]|uniref:Glycosyl-hydrolase family 116 catalytic region domain-containing protein n=1 Tax=Paenibacillus allorhizoplanae TaxID=2905648 RepID=A0ABN8GWV7_9BACL|nr:hypothetical protein [Paenibacillus allorhizoplanae]CAH1220360.1 hypothetical protein PAECIP111891_05005 [Paenibacillus allorhizoplanae]
MRTTDSNESSSEANIRWHLGEGAGIVWDIHLGHLAHQDHVEMSGKEISLIVMYGIDSEGGVILKRKVVWPGLRTIPNDTHASLMEAFGQELMPSMRVGGQPVQEKLFKITFDGILHMASVSDQGVLVRRTVFPTRDKPYALERVQVQNMTEDSVQLEIGRIARVYYRRGTKGVYKVETGHDAPSIMELRAGETLEFKSWICASTLQGSYESLDVLYEERKRREFLKEIGSSLQLETPEPHLNRMFDLAKIRAAESIFRTKCGFMHCPGGGSYYAAVWTNDQAEYAGPFFPFLGEQDAMEASLNAYRLYMPFMGPDFHPIPSSIIAEGVDIWEGAGDRGDAAMYAYGAARFALASGSLQIAEQLWPAIEWCLAYCRRKRNQAGVVASDSDELENRFPSGDANLFTSSLAYGALLSSAHLARAVGKADQAPSLEEEAAELRQAIEAHFGATIEGYETYRYYEGNDILRSWICVPLTMNILDRKEQTIAALFSSRLWVNGGLVTQAGETTYWDRSTLYALRGILYAGEIELGITYLLEYSRNRLLGEHVPYAVEAFPEGNGRHLSAESALYARVIVEGLFGIVPTGLRTFSCSPRMPEHWDTMALRSIRAFDSCFDLVVTRGDEGVLITCVTPEKQEIYLWDQDGPITIHLR